MLSYFSFNLINIVPKKNKALYVITIKPLSTIEWK